MKRAGASSKAPEVMMGRRVIRHSAASLTLGAPMAGPSAEDLMRSKQVTALKPGAQDVPDIGMQVVQTLLLGGTGGGEETGGRGASTSAAMAEHRVGERQAY